MRLADDVEVLPPERLVVSAPLNAAPAAGQLGPVLTLQPRLWVRRAGPSSAPTVRGVKGVAWAAPVRIAQATLTGVKTTAKVKVAIVETDSFRPLAPQEAADALDIWRRLGSGEAAFAPQTARRLRLSGGQTVRAGTTSTLTVGAIAPMIDPPLAEVLLTRAAADAIGLTGEDTVLVAVEPKVSPDTVARRLRAAKLSVQTITPTFDDPNKIVPFTYVERDGGMIEMQKTWVDRYIVSGRVPILGSVRCHRVMIPQLRAALEEIEREGLAGLIDRRQYGGCWVPRHIDFNPALSISMHAWGLAVDLNVSTNQLGATPTMDPRIVDVFRRWGFTWGGVWSRPDGMHFQLGALVRAVQG